VGAKPSDTGKAKAGAARQLHSGTVAGAAGRLAAASRATTKQAVDFKHFFSAQKFSNPICGAPVLKRHRFACRLSTKLSTEAVDDESVRPARLASGDTKSHNIAGSGARVTP
jgi:hypothetical protein